MYTVYILYTGATPGFWFEGETSEKISYMTSFKVLYCNDISVRGGGHSAQIYLSKTNFEKFIKEFSQKFKNSPKFFKNKI